MTTPDLEYVALVVEQPDRVAAIFERDFGLPREDHTVSGVATPVPMIALGQSALALFSVGDPFLGDGIRKGVHHIALSAQDPVAAAQRLEGAGIGADSGLRPGLDGRAQISLSLATTCGVRVRYTEPLSARSSSGPGPNNSGPVRSDMVERIDHLGVASTDNRAARAVFVDSIGCLYESQQTDSEVETIAENFISDTYPFVFQTRPSTLLGSLRVTFITAGDCELEFLQDLTAAVVVDEARHDSGGNTRGDRSAVARFVDGRGAGLHHIALKTPDIEAALGRLAAAGHRMIDTRGRPGSRRAQIGFVHPSALGGVLLHFVQRQEV